MACTRVPTTKSRGRSPSPKTTGGVSPGMPYRIGKAHRNRAGRIGRPRDGREAATSISRARQAAGVHAILSAFLEDPPRVLSGDGEQTGDFTLSRRGAGQSIACESPTLPVSLQRRHRWAHVSEYVLKALGNLRQTLEPVRTGADGDIRDSQRTFLRREYSGYDPRSTSKKGWPHVWWYRSARRKRCKSEK